MSVSLEYYAEVLEGIRNQGLYKEERLISCAQRPELEVSGKLQVLNMCANNYLGLANHPAIISAAHDGLNRWGFGMASVRFICGTQEIHKELERQVSNFLGTDDTILYSSCFDANGGLFETILGAEDAVISDELNHASIIDGIRLCKARRFRYRNRDMGSLEAQLQAAGSARIKLIATDGVFSMDGTYAPLDRISQLAEQYGALLMVDDSHATGIVGATGRGTPEIFNVQEKVDIVSGTFGKALGGASGGFISGRKEIIALLRQRSRPYLFSNTMPPPVVYASLRALELVTESELRQKLCKNTDFFRTGMKNAGFDISEGDHPIVPIMLGDAFIAQKMAEILFGKGIYAVGFFYPVVPEGKARIRVQISAAHTRDELEYAIKSFMEARDKINKNK